MSEPFLGQIAIYGFNFAPRGWAMCNGQLLSIAQNTALFALLGTTYGGNGQTTFALPDLRGRFPLHAGQGPGLPPYVLGQEAGNVSVTLTTGNMPASQIFPPVSNQEANAKTPVGNVPAVTEAAAYINSANAQGAPINTGGQSQPVDLMNPYLAVNFCIALEGIFPSRN